MEEHHIIHEGYGDYRLRKQQGHNVNVLMLGIILIIVGIVLLAFGGLLIILIGGVVIWFSLRTNKEIEHEKQIRRTAPITRISYD